MLFGVALFSYVMGIFIGILGSFQKLGEDVDEGDSLILFFDLIKKLNGGKPLNYNL